MVVACLACQDCVHVIPIKLSCCDSDSWCCHAVRCGTMQWRPGASRTAACAHRCWRCARARGTRPALWPCTTACATRPRAAAWRRRCMRSPLPCAPLPTAAAGRRLSASGPTWSLPAASPQVRHYSSFFSPLISFQETATNRWAY